MKRFALLIIALIFCNIPNIAMAGEQQGYLFGEPVIFEISASHGWMRDTSEQGLLNLQNRLLVINDAQGGEATVSYNGLGGLITLEEKYTTIPYQMPTITGTTLTTQPLEAGFSHTQELNFAIRSPLSDNLSGFVQFGYARLKGNMNQNQSFNINAVAITPYGRSELLGFDSGIIYYVEPGHFTQSFSGSGSADINFPETEVLSFEIGMKKNISKFAPIANIKAQPFIDFSIGLAGMEGLYIESRGQLPDLTNAVTADFKSSITIRTNTTDNIYELPHRNVTATVSGTHIIKVADAALRPTLVVGAGMDFSLRERTSLSFEAHYKHLKMPSPIRNQNINLSRLTLGLRLSQTF